MGLLSEVENGLSGGEVQPKYSLISVRPALEELMSPCAIVPRVDPSALEINPSHLNYKTGRP